MNFNLVAWLVRGKTGFVNKKIGEHYEKVAPNDKKVFCKLSGWGVISVGAGLAVTAVIIGITDSALSFIAFAFGFALLGWAFAFPETSFGAKDYAEDMSFVPLGYIIMFAWLAIMITAIILLRKNKANFLSFIISWFMGVVGCLVVIFLIGGYMT